MENLTANKTRESSDLEWLFQKVEVARAAWQMILVSFLTLSILGCGTVYAITRPVYSSHMVLPLTSHLQALVLADAILGPGVGKIRSMDGPNIAERQRPTSGLVALELKKGSGLFSVSVKGHSAQAAQAILNEVLAQIVAVSKPSGTALASIQQQVDSKKRALTELKGLSAVLRENASRPKGGSEGEPYARSFAIMVSEIATKEQEIWELQNRMDGLRVEDVIVPPSLASAPDPASLARALALILLASLILPILFVLLRDAWRKWNGSQGNSPSMQRAA